jgi:hypothetical protein
MTSPFRLQIHRAVVGGDVYLCLMTFPVHSPSQAIPSILQIPNLLNSR